jgi:primosomal protein N''
LAWAQEPTLEALLAEVRLLRQALERQGVVATRTQLLVSRLALQDQRVARSRAALERLESELASGTQESSTS